MPLRVLKAVVMTSSNVRRKPSCVKFIHSIHWGKYLFDLTFSSLLSLSAQWLNYDMIQDIYSCSAIQSIVMYYSLFWLMIHLFIGNFIWYSLTVHLVVTILDGLKKIDADGKMWYWWCRYESWLHYSLFLFFYSFVIFYLWKQMSSISIINVATCK